jgi:hypothetical protein
MKETKKNNEGLIKDVYESIIGEIQTLVTVGYIIAVGIGMLFTFKKYNLFGINIFDYAEVFDFLIAPFSDLKILIFSVISISVILFIVRIDSFSRKRFPKSYSKMNLGMDKKSWFDPVRCLIYFVGVLYYLHLSSDLYGMVVKKNIENTSKIKVEFVDGDVLKGILIGKTKDVLFLKKDEKVTVVPISSMVKEFEIN